MGADGLACGLHVLPSIAGTVLDAGQVCLGMYLSVWNPVLPLHVEEFPEARCVEVVQLLGMALVHCPCFTCVEQRGEHCIPSAWSVD